MAMYAVGKLYHPNRTRWPQSPQFNFRSGLYELVLFFENATKAEIDAVRRDPAEFALTTTGNPDLLFFLYRFGSRVPWGDAPYSWHMVPADQRSLPVALAPEQGILLPIILVEATTGIILAMRQVSLSPHFSRALVDHIIAQAARPFSQPRYDAALTRTYMRYPDSAQMITDAVARTHGGD